MTEVVTSYAASSQLNLLASRQQVSGVSTVTSQPDAPTAESNALQSVLAAADKAEDKSFAAQLSAHSDSTAGHGAGTPRPRVEIKQFDVGLSAAEVVGTQDVLQRFDANGDGRVDTLEADKAALVRQKVFTFAGLAAAPHVAPQISSAPELSESEAPALARETGAAIAALAGYEDRKFSASLIQEPGVKKFFAEVAEQGAPAGVVDAPKKYYGQGAEVVVAGQVGHGANTQVKFADRAPVKDHVLSEEGTGEVKYYDRVPQAEAGDTGAETSAQTYSEKAQEIAAAYAASQGETSAETPVVTVVTA